MSNLVKTKTVCIVSLKDGTSFECPEDKVNAVMEGWNKKKFVGFKEPVDGLRGIDGAMISKMSDSIDVPVLPNLNNYWKAQYKNRIKEFENNLGRKPSETEKHNIYLKYLDKQKTEKLNNQ